ncbi:MAG: hypothetical protein HRU35_01860 [Rickettsiaceae bacterium]|nr:hypothetical protein [Rickettsiaceae bacterium]
MTNKNLLLLLFLTLLFTVPSAKASDLSNIYAVSISWVPEIKVIAFKEEYDPAISYFDIIKNNKNPNNIDVLFYTHDEDCFEKQLNAKFDKNNIKEETWINLESKFAYDKKLAEYAWQIFGVCAGFTEDMYFKKTYEISNKIIENNIYLNDYIGKSMLLGDWLKLFGGKDSAIMYCNYDYDEKQYYFQEIILFWDKAAKKQTKIPKADDPQSIQESTCPRSELIYLRTPENVLTSL